MPEGGRFAAASPCLPGRRLVRRSACRLGGGDARRRRAASRRGARSARAADHALFARVAAHLFRAARPLRERRPGERPGRNERRALRHGPRPRRHRLVPRRRPEGAHGLVHAHPHGPRAHQGPRFHGDLARARGRAAMGAGRQRVLPRLLGPRLHEGRPAPRHRGGLPRAGRVRAPARPEGLPRRRREPHRGRDPPLGRDDVPLARGAAVPRLPGQAVLRTAIRGRQALPLRLRALPAAPADRAAGEAEPEAAGVAQRRHAVPQPRRHRLRLVLGRVLRAGGLVRPRRRLHRAAVRRRRAREGVGGLDPGVRDRRVQGRHREARGPRVLRGVGAEDPRSRRSSASAACPR
jgi:hypothetical protein